MHFKVRLRLKTTRFDHGLFDRVATVMAYLSEPEAGGNTVFPQLGLGVKPEVKRKMKCHKIIAEL